MKLRLLLLNAVLAFAIPSLRADKTDFSYENDDYQLRFSIIDEGAKTCKVRGFEIFNSKINIDLEIPSIVNGYYVTEIGEKAFYNDGLENYAYFTSVTIPDCVTYIGKEAFNNCFGLTSIELGNSVEVIDNWAFANCKRLKSVRLPDSVNSLGYGCFSWCEHLTFINIPESISFIGGQAFENCMELARAEFSSIESLCGIHFGTEMSNPLWCSHRLIIAGEEVTDLVIPNSIASIGNCSFVGGIYISSITIPNSVKSIGHYAFSFCEGLTSVKIPSSVIEIGQGAFAYCSGLSSIEIPTSVTMIERSTFKYCSNLSCINLPESITGIGRSAFEGCSTLTSIIIPKSLTSIGQESFKSCENLDTIIMGPNIKDLEYQCFIGCPVSNIYITAPFPPETYDPFDSYSAVLHLQGKASIEAYQADEVWSKFKRELMVEASDLRIEGESYVSGNPGETFQLKADIYPADVTLPYIYWRSTNPRIATVDSDGLVTLLGDDDEEETRAEEANSRDNSCKIIAESLYYDGPIAEVTVYNSDFNGVETVMDEWTEGGIDYMLPYELYNLSGAKVEDSVDGLGKGIYILRQGKHAVKIAVK